MADSREFLLIGAFEDRITPALEGINKSLAQVKRTFESFGAKRGGTDTLTKSIGKVIGAHINLRREVKELREEMQKSFSTISEYNRLMGKAVGANKILRQSTEQSFKKQGTDIASATTQLRRYGNLAKLYGLDGSSRRRGGGYGGGGYGGGPYGGPPRAPRVGGGYGGGGPNGPGPGGPRGGGGPVRRLGGGGDNFGESVTAYAVGQRLSSFIENGIMSGFRMGVSLFQTTFQYVGDSFRERIEDQITDLQAAGGNLAIAERQKEQGKNPFVKNLTDSIRFTQKTNLVLDKLANDLPGSNQDYIEVGKRLSDTMATLADYNKKGTLEFAKRLQGGNEDVYKDQKITGTGSSQDVKNAITTIVGEFSKKIVIGGFGGSVGAGGVRGPNSLGGIMERLISNPDLTFAKVKTYASTFDPKILNALKRAFPRLDEAGDDMLKRAEIVNEMLDEIANPSMIAASKRTVKGVLDSYRGTFFSPESGLLGFGRKLGEVNKGTAPMIDEMGRYIKKEVDKFGQEIYTVVDSAEKASKETLSIFEMIGDLMANYGAILKPIADNLYLIWDPLKQLGDVLQKARDLSVVVFQEFRNYALGMEEIAKKIDDKEIKDLFLQTRNFRASLLTLTNMFKNMGIFSEEDFWRLREVIIDPKKGMPDLGKVLNEIVTKFFDSDGAKQLGEFFGTLLGTIAVELAKITGFFADKVKGGGKLTEGFTSAFNAVGGQTAVIQIFKDIFQMLFDALLFVLTKIDWRVYLVAGGLLVIPALIQGFTVQFVKNFTRGFNESFANLFGGSDDAMKAASKRPKGPLPMRPVPKSGGLKYESYVPEPAKPGLGKRIGMGVRNLTGGPKSVVNRYLGSPKRALASMNSISKGLTGGRSRNILGAKNAVKPIPVSIANVAKNAASGTANLLPKGMKMLGKAGGALTVGYGIYEAIMALLSGDSLGTALGKGAGPILGTIIGTALLGPIGGVIGGMIGSMDQVTEPLAKGFDAMFGTLGVTFEFLGQIGTDLLGLINGLVRMIPGVNKGFDVLRGAVDLLVLPFRMLKLLIMGLYEAYLRLKEKLPGGLSEDEKKKKIQLYNDRMKENASIELDVSQGYTKENKAKYQKELERLRAKGEGGGERARTIESAIKQIEAKLQNSNRAEGTQSTLNGKPVTWNGSKWVPATTSTTPAAAPAKAPAAPALGNITPPAPSAKPKEVPQEIKTTATSTSALNQKATEQTTQTTTVSKNTTIANVTLGNIRVGLIQISNKLTGIQNALLGDLNNIQAGVTSISNLLHSGNLKVKTDSIFGGGPMGTATGNLGQAQNLASQMGLGLTSHFRAGDPGYHGLGRAMDFSNGIGTREELAFAHAMISKYGSTIKELIHTPLGFGIKNGVKVPLSYWGERVNAMHYNHVHVAFADGPENGKAFGGPNGLAAARSYESAMVPGSVKIDSFTRNASEGFGQHTYGDINVTVNAGNISDHKQLAIAVAREIGNAIGDVQASGIFV